MYKENNLSKNQQIIFDLINKSSEPLKAYTILFSVQKKGIKAPPQVYRALDKLVETGKIHKIESKNAFVACRNSNCEISKATAFSICESCEMVDEIREWSINKIANIEPVGSKFAIYEEFEEWIELDDEESIEILSSGKKIVDKPLED